MQTKSNSLANCFGKRYELNFTEIDQLTSETNFEWEGSAHYDFFS
jgi:hypothetical protein